MRIELLIAGVVLISACSNTPSNEPSGTCFPMEIPCADRTDCIGMPGTRCNLAIDNPMCQTLRCAQNGDACSEAELCAVGSTCSSENLCVEAMTVEEERQAFCVELGGLECERLSTLANDSFDLADCMAQIETRCPNTPVWPASCAMPTVSETRACLDARGQRVNLTVETSDLAECRFCIE